MSFAEKLQPKPAPFIAEPDTRFWFRRAIGFTIKATIDEPWQARIIVRRHGGVHELAIGRSDLRRLMAMDAFAELDDRAWLERFEAQDLVYFSRTPSQRTTTGAPLATARDAEAKIALRDGVNLTLAIADENEITPLLFMPRRGALATKTFRGLRFSSLEAGSEAYALDLYGSPAAVSVLRQLMPLLDGSASFAEVEARFAGPARARARTILEWLDDCGMLAAGDTKDPALAGDGPFVAWLGHAAVLVKVGEATLMVDPLFIRRNVPPKVHLDEPLDWRALPKPDAVLITHGDNDHLNPPTLVQIDASMPIVVPKERVARPYQVDLKEVLGFLRFTDVRELDDWSSLMIGDTRVTAVPFLGEDWGLDLTKATYLVEGPRGRVYLSADSFNTKEIFERVRERGPVDFAFLGISGCEEPLVAPPGYGYGEFYAVWLPRAQRNEWILHTQGPSAAAVAAQTLDARHVFGYAAGGGSFMDMSHSDRGTQADLAAALEELRLGERATTLELGVPFSLTE
ncbi:MAG: MBL fold metallo-hydrolase [Deltaproteobacteria bacterium]|nr:MBL fold metallo-hydrolase [Deltaproteobacteria bacterium]